MILFLKEDELNSLILATQTGGILGPFAWILGKILEVIYDGLSFFGIYNIGICIVVFTLVVRMLMFPMTIKQQKFTKMNSVMNPEIQAIQKKYKNKKDQQSQLAQQEEIRAVYDKYGTSPTGSCLPLLIQMPILFALYQVIYNIPAYVAPVKNLYISLIHGFNAGTIEKLFSIKGKAGIALSGSEINSCIDKMMARGNNNFDQVLSASTDTEIVDKIKGINNFFGLDISATPSSLMATSVVIALLIPVLSGLFQFLSVQVANKVNKAASTADNPMAGSMKMMNIIMPLFSAYICYSLQIGVGIYWIASSLISMIQTIIANIHLRKLNVDDIIEQNKEKAAQKAEKRKQKEGIYREKVLEASKTNTKSVKSTSGMSAEEKEEKIRKAKEKLAQKEGSLSSKVNMVNNYNKQNEK